MAIEAAKLQVKVESNALTVSGEVEQLNRKVNESGETGSKDLGKLTKGFNLLQSEVLPAVGIVTGFGATVKKAFEFGEEGAQIEQMRDSASELADSLGGNLDDIVSAVDKATNHTIDDAQIVKSASTAMLLGLGADADQLANLAEIAASRGRMVGETTSQAFDDIVRGIGRQSPMILDNLGIVIDAETTYGEYAASVGKSSDALTENEKKQALLNSVLDSGNKLLADTGGLTETNATKYEQATSRLQNALDKLKEKMTPFFADVAEGLAGVLSYRDQIADMNDEFTQSSIQAGTSYDDYIQKALGSEAQYSAKAAELLERWQYLQSVKASGDTNTLDYQMTLDQLDEELAKFGLIPQSIYLAQTATDNWTTAWKQNHDAANGAADAAKTFADSVIQAGIKGDLKSIYGDYQKSLEDLKEENLSLGGSVEFFKEQYASAPAKIAELTQALIENKAAQAETGYTSGILVTKQKDLEVELEKWNNVLESGKGNIEAYNEKLSDNEKAQQDLSESTKEAVRQMLYEQASAGLTGEALYEMARAMGVMDDESYNAALMQQSLRDEYDQGVIKADEYAGKTADLAAAIAALKDKNVTITVTTVQEYITKYETYRNESSSSYDSDAQIPGVNGYYSSDGQWISYHSANGLDVTVPPGYENDNYMIPISAKSGERVTVTPAGQSPLINNNKGGDTYNLYFQDVGASADDIERALRQSRRRA